MKTLTNRQLIKEFNKFLKENECASKFYVNRAIYVNSAVCKKAKIPVFLTKTIPFDWVVSAFTWSDTPQERDYWVKIADKWRSYLRKENIHLKEIGHKS